MHYLNLKYIIYIVFNLFQSQTIKLKSQHNRQLKKLLTIAQNPNTSKSIDIRKSLSLDPYTTPTIDNTKSFTIKMPHQFQEYSSDVLSIYK